MSTDLSGELFEHIGHQDIEAVWSKLADLYRQNVLGKILTSRSPNCDYPVHSAIMVGCQKNSYGSDVITALMSAAYELGAQYIDAIMLQQNLAPALGNTLSTAIYRDRLLKKGEIGQSATRSILAAIEDERHLVQRYLIYFRDPARNNDTFLHRLCREDASDETLAFGLRLLKRHRLLEEAYQSLNADGDTPLHILARRGDKQKAAMLIKAIEGTPALVMKCLSVRGHHDCTPYGYGANFEDEDGLTHARAETQRYLRDAFDKATAASEKCHPEPAKTGHGDRIGRGRKVI